MPVAASAAGDVVVLTLDRPPANAMDTGLLHDLVAAVATLADDPPRALVIAGVDPFFSGGVDLRAVADYGADEYAEVISGINAMVLGVYSLPCPVIGAVTGHAIAGGLVLALCTDTRVASDRGRYGLTEIKVGISFPQAAIGVVGAELSPHARRRVALGSQLLDAEECLRLGVFDELVPPSEVLPRALAIAQERAALSPQVYARTKLDLRRETLKALQAASEGDPLLNSDWLADPAYRTQALAQLGIGPAHL